MCTFHQAPITSACREDMLAMQLVWNSVPSRSWRTYGPINPVWTSSTMLPWWVVRHRKSPDRLFLPSVCLPGSCDFSSQNYEFISKSKFLILCDKYRLSLHVSSYVILMWSIQLAALTCCRVVRSVRECNCQMEWGLYVIAIQKGKR